MLWHDDIMSRRHFYPFTIPINKLLLFHFSLGDIILKTFLLIFEMDEDFWSSLKVLQAKNL